MTFIPTTNFDFIFNRKMQIFIPSLLIIFIILLTIYQLISISDFFSSVALIISILVFIKSLDEGPNFVILDIHGEETFLKAGISTPIIRIKFIIQNIGDKMGYIEFQSTTIIVYDSSSKYFNANDKKEYISSIVKEEFQMSQDSQIPKALVFEFLNHKDMNSILNWKKAKLHIKGFYTTHKGKIMYFDKKFEIIKDVRHIDKFDTSLYV